MLEPEVVLQPLHEAIVRRDLKQHLNDLLPEVQNEIACAMDEALGIKTNFSIKVNLDATVRRIIARASNRAFVGLPLCVFSDSPTRKQSC